MGQPAAFTLTGAPGSQVLTLAGQPITLAPGQSLVVHVTAATTSTSCATYNNSASLASTNGASPPRARSRSPSTAATSPSPRPPTPRASAPGARSATSSPSPTTAPARSPASPSATACRRRRRASPGASTRPTRSRLDDRRRRPQLRPGAPAADASVHVHVTSPTTSATCGTVINWAAADSTNDGSPSVGPTSIAVNCPDLAITKVADAAWVSAGDTIGYTVTISNTGQGDATGVSLTDNLPGGNAATPVTWVIDNGVGQPAAFTLTGAPGSQVLTLAGQPITLAPGQSLVVHVTAATTSTSCATYDNSASLASTNGASPTVGPITITVNCGDLAITKTADAPSVSAGSPIGYVVTVTNNGAGTVIGLTVSDSLPTTPPGLTWSIDAADSIPAGRSPAASSATARRPAADRLGPRPRHEPDHLATCGTVRNCATADSTNDGSPSVGPTRRSSVNCPDLASPRSPTRPASRPATRSATRSRSATRARATPPASASPTACPAATPPRPSPGSSTARGQPGRLHADRRPRQPGADPRRPADHARPGPEPRGPRHGGHDLDQLRHLRQQRQPRQHQRHQPTRSARSRSPSTAATSPSPRPPTPRASAPGARSATSSPSPTTAPARSPASPSATACRRRPRASPGASTRPTPIRAGRSPAASSATARRRCCRPPRSTSTSRARPPRPRAARS